ncbi:protein SFI1 homolog isoform X2 [Tenrec ecaudatus]|uniref:protein SFI1 homolog isoform X2 n=1 Tax=Tenrec ecaudatus TaxID=94439 RepID=UPI003F5A946F
MKKAHSVRVQSSTKPSAFPGVRGRLPSALHPVHHHASYRRGRLKDLRVRCMTRKFLFLWIRKTFGRISPTKARCYYEQRVQRKVFEEWKEEWWISHREWKLCVRADCHYRYYLYNLMFQTWQTYVRQQQETRRKYSRAEDHDAKQKIRQAWKSWVIYVVMRRTKLGMQMAASGLRQRSTLRVWWSKWRWRLGQVHMDRVLHTTAVKHRALSLQLQAWSRWHGQYLCAQRDRQKVVSAVKYHQHWQKRSCLRAWLVYVQLRRRKKQRNEMADRFYHITLLQTRFCDWQWAWQWKESLHAHQALVQVLARRMALRRAFVHWKHYKLLCAEAAAQHRMAEEHRRRHLLSVCFRALKDNVARAQLQQIRKNLAHQQRKATLLRGFWDCWQRGLELREEREQLSSMHAARDHYRSTLLLGCIKRWTQHVQRRRHKQLLQAGADGHFQQRALPAAFQTWRSLCRRHQQERARNARAARFHRETLGRQVFAVWQQKTLQHRESRLVERVAILHAERQLLLRAWSTWHQQAAACHQERQRQAVACAHHRQWQLQRAFRVWRESAQGRRTEKLGKARAAEFHAVQLLRWAWNRWRECLALLNAERQKLVQADRHRQCTLLRRVWRGWVTYQDRGRQVLREVAAREGQHNRRLLRGMLQRWHENTVARVDEAQKARQAHHHYRRIICSKVLAQWREASAVQIYYRQQEDWTVQEARRMLDRGCVQIVFRRWQSRSQSVAQQRVQMERAAQHHRRRLLREAVARWKAYHLGCIRKALLRRQSAQLLVERLSRSCFRQWSRQLVAQREEQQGTAKALWFWSISLQAKAWDAWQRFMLERKRKKARLERAAQAHQQQLLREGVTQLLQFAAGQKASRQQWHAQQQAQVAHGLHRAVRHCAMLWKQKALGPAKYPLTSKPTTPSRRVTFEVPLVSLISAGAGDAALETKRPRAKPEPSLDSLALAAGDSRLLELSAARPVRRQPRCPDFLLEPEQSRVLGCRPHQGPRPEKVPHPGVSQPASTSLPQPSQEEAWMAPAPCSSLPQPKTLPRPPGLKEPPTRMAGPKLVLLPPSSFMPRRGRTAAGVSVQPHSAPPLAGPPDPQLLLPGDFTGPQAWPELAPASAGSAPLQAELAGIRQQLQHYQSTKQNLCSCQRQANILRRWLELSREEPRPEDQEAEQQVQKELEEVEAQIQHLTATLRAQHQPIGTCIARVRALRQALS